MLKATGEGMLLNLLRLRQTLLRSVLGSCLVFVICGCDYDATYVPTDQEIFEFLAKNESVVNDLRENFMAEPKELNGLWIHGEGCTINLKDAISKERIDWYEAKCRPLNIHSLHRADVTTDDFDICLGADGFLDSGTHSGLAWFERQPAENPKYINRRYVLTYTATGRPHWFTARWRDLTPEEIRQLPEEAPNQSGIGPGGSTPRFVPVNPFKQQ